MSFKLTTSDKRLLRGVHPDLVKVIVKATEISPFPFRVTEGLRTVAQQRENIRKGVSWTMNSRHLTGHAVDIVPLVDINGDGKVSTAEMYAWPMYYKLAAVMKQAAKAVGVPVEWGGDWRKNKDGPHWQLPFKQYPAARSAGFLQIPEDSQAEIADADPTDPETDTGAAYKSVAYAGSAAATGVSIGANPLSNVVDGLMQQQNELTSGDVARIAVALLIVGLGLYLAFHKARGDGGNT